MFLASVFRLCLEKAKLPGGGLGTFLQVPQGKTWVLRKLYQDTLRDLGYIPQQMSVGFLASLRDAHISTTDLTIPEGQKTQTFFSLQTWNLLSQSLFHSLLDPFILPTFYLKPAALSRGQRFSRGGGGPTGTFL